MADLIDRQSALKAVFWDEDAQKNIEVLPDIEAVEVVRCCKCCYWDRDTIRYQHNDFRAWNEAECMVLAERDGYNEIDHYVEADDYCSRGERRTDE